MRLVAEFARAERMALNTADLAELGASIYDEMVGLGPLEPLLKDDSINDILAEGVGIGSDENEITIITGTGETHVPRTSKAACAAAIVDEIEAGFGAS